MDQAQLLSYLRLLDLRIGLLLNFNVVALEDGLKRMVNDYQDFPRSYGYSELHQVTAEIAENTRRER